MHQRPARTERGWRTATSGDGKGWPDIFAIRGPRILVAELKSAKGKLAPDQAEWLRAFIAAGVESYVWRPDEWTDRTIEKILR